MSYLRDIGNLLVPYAEDVSTWENLVFVALGPPSGTSAGSPLYPRWVSIVIEAAYYGRGDVLTVGDLGKRMDRSSEVALLCKRGGAFLRVCTPETIIAIRSIRDLGGPKAVAVFLEAIS